LETPQKLVPPRLQHFSMNTFDGVYKKNGVGARSRRLHNSPPPGILLLSVQGNVKTCAAKTIECNKTLGRLPILCVPAESCTHTCHRRYPSRGRNVSCVESDMKHELGRRATLFDEINTAHNLANRVGSAQTSQVVRGWWCRERGQVARRCSRHGHAGFDGRMVIRGLLREPWHGSLLHRLQSATVLYKILERPGSEQQR
jgi:hypothetical protein